MLEPGRVARFPDGALAQHIAFRLGQTGFDVDLLDRDRSLQALVDGTPNYACAAATNPLDQAVMLRDQLTGIDGAYSEPSRNVTNRVLDRSRVRHECSWRAGRTGH
ncbi:hypothetical protein FMUAM8_21550 [Nocardia cyriacigeorgica]|nr:hypothetical protein FMUAM8_21550 [Nocardia cyriacigeorgica]